MKGDCGDFYALAGVIVDVEAAAEKPGDPKSELVYNRNAPRDPNVIRERLGSAVHDIFFDRDVMIIPALTATAAAVCH